MTLFMILPRWLRILFVFLIISVVAALYLFVSNQVFRESALNNYLATAAGIIGGVPVALWLSARQEQVADRKAQLEQSKLNEQQHLEQIRIKQERQTRVLGIIQKELQHNLDIMYDRKRNQSGTSPYLNYPGVKIELWSA